MSFLLQIIQDLLLIFNNRELAIILWIGVALVALLGMKSFRSALSHTLLLLTKKIFIIVFASLAVYVSLVLFALNEFGVITQFDRKDIVIWFLTVAIPLIFKVNKAKDEVYFKVLFWDGLKFTALLEFIINFYSFSLLTEIIVFPVLLLIIAVQAFSETESKYFRVSSFLTNLLSYVGLFFIAYTAYRTYHDYENFFQFATLKTFILPIILTTVFIPFLYCWALFIIYESYFIRLDFMTNKKEKIKEVKKYILLEANLSLTKLNRIRKNFDKTVFYNGTDLKIYIQGIIRNKMLD